MELKYQTGFHNFFQSEAQIGALPTEQNSPQKCNLGLYAEQLSGSAFTAPRSSNLASWLYRIRPSVMHGSFKPCTELTKRTFLKPNKFNPNQMRWNPLSSTHTKDAANGDFLESLRTLCGTGPAADLCSSHCGVQIHLYAFNKDMGTKYLMNADGEFLFVPQKGAILAATEFGQLRIEPGEILVIPRGIKFQIARADVASTSTSSSKPEVCSGYIGENFGAPFRLPELGVIGANGLAHPRHFLSPTAFYRDLEGSFELFGKFRGEIWCARLMHDPLDVVAWHGNYAPYKYDLRKFNTINTVSYDHPDPSIFTVLTSLSDTPGIANIDFVIFPPRWMVAETTFRPPYFHRNCMSEYMGLIYGVYDAKTSGGFVPGGGSLHNFYSAHGPDAGSYEKAISTDLSPHKIDHALAFMFESRAPYLLTDFAFDAGFLQPDYQDCWQGFKKNFVQTPN